MREQNSDSNHYVGSERKNDISGDNKFQLPATESSEEDDLDDNLQSFDLHTTNQCTIDEENAQIREFFNMECKICSDPVLQFETLKQIRKHYRKIHNVAGYITCCGSTFRRRTCILDHVKYHLNPNAFLCELCDKQFRDGTGLQKHMNLVHPLDSSEHKCKVCAKSFAKPWILAKHESSQHGPQQKDKTLECDRCDKK